jgi:hypothetical protein
MGYSDSGKYGPQTPGTKRGTTVEAMIPESPSMKP